ncbi:MAG TPA: hypothetical protein VFY03_08605 [Woeseiaceae bacterium]|nr:hypothetical protein [Woeseiaceae bacterium]
MNYRLPNWRDHTVQTGDEQLALAEWLPLAVRMQAYVQGRDGESIDPITGEVGADASVDFQAPYLVKLLSSAPLTENISYYFYMIFAEKGTNTEVIVEDAWISYTDLFGSGADMMLGQFQVSDLMFPREIRMTFQDFMTYRFSGVTYDRGLLFGRGFGPLDVSLGFVNGNGIESNYDLNSPGYRRPDKLFDNDTGKSVFGRLGTEIGAASAGLFGLAGEQFNATGPAATESGTRKTDKIVAGIDVSGRFADRWYWFGQVLWNRWEGFLDPANDYEWVGGFAGVDYVHSDKWVFSGLVNLNDAGDLADSDTIYEGIDMRTFTLSGSYYFMRNVKGVIELNVDLLDTQPQTGTYHTGHLSEENYVLVGIDAAF